MTLEKSHSARPVQAVILAGGSGSRLWPLSRQQLPKQFLCVDGGSTMLQATIDRLQPMIKPADVWVVTGEEHAKGEAYHMLSSYNTIMEPEGRNTAPAIAIAAALLQEQGGDQVMVVLPADHMIKDVEAFQTHLAGAVEAAEQGWLITFGITPTRPDTGFGYIKTAKQPSSSGSEVLQVERFTEKPDLGTAEAFLREGAYYWNSGMFVWRTSVILKEIETHLPDVYKILEDIRAGWRQGQEIQHAIKAHFSRMPNVSIDYGVLEKAGNVGLIPSELGWSDVGSWDAVYEIADKDQGGNSIQGKAIALDCKNTLIRGDKRTIAVIGVEDLNIVETPDAILITKRGQSQRVREVVDALRSGNGQEHICHLTVRRPWGSYSVLDDQASNFKIKRIEVNPGASLSLQSHQHRSEHWVVVSGTATIVRGEETLIVTKNESTYIPIGFKHRLQNKGKIPLQMIEVQVGEYLEENDIQRFDDEYGRPEN